MQNLSLTHRQLIRDIRVQQKKCSGLSDSELRTLGIELKFEAMCGTSIRHLLTRAYGAVVEAARRILGFEHYDVQLLGGIHLAFGKIVEMKTGEGKTLTAALPAFIHALYGRGAHVITANDYLAERDCKEIGPIYKALGLKPAFLTGESTPEERQAAYQADIVYGAAKEYGFDFLRDRLKNLQDEYRSQKLMRGLNFALVDEADSIMIDEARTPLIIGMIDSAEEKVSQDCYEWAADCAKNFVEKQDFSYDQQKQKVELTLAGRTKIRRMPQRGGTKEVSIHQLYSYIENAIKVRRDFHCDKNYAVVDGSVVIIDEFTGRPAEGRQWQQGIHQSVEAKEKLEITPATRQAATITIQNFFRRYQILSGMTGTAWTSRREFRRVYKKKVVQIPCHRPVRRANLKPRIFVKTEDKFQAIADESLEVIKNNRSVLIGTRSVAKSELLSSILTKSNIEHQVLNARYLEKEADIVARAGEKGRVTVATNMAGRGTDIKLEDIVTTSGGLHVILTELHESQRIDWQLIGRGARQGNPGSFRIFVSLDDELILLGLGPKTQQRLLQRYEEQTELPRKLFKIFRTAQNRVERKHLVDRMVLMRQDKDRQQKLLDSGGDEFLDVISS